MASGTCTPAASTPLRRRRSSGSRHILLNRYADPPRPVYGDLLALVGDRDYFVLTTNVDHCFQKAGFDRHRLFYTQGGLRPVAVLPALPSKDL